MAEVPIDQGDLNQAKKLYEEALAITREIGDKHGEGRELGNIALVYAQQGDFPTAEKIYGESTANARETGDKHGLSVDKHQPGPGHSSCMRGHRGSHHSIPDKTLDRFAVVRTHKGELTMQQKKHKGRGSIYQRPECGPYWYINYSVGGRRRARRKRSHPLGCSTRSF
jgi:tetratricopeptide (TPR) repeat protein